jgi:phage portal protein BeeE
MSLLGPLLVHGNALDEVDEGAGGVIRFRPPTGGSRSRSGRGATASPAGSSTRTTTIARTVGADTVLHIAWWSPLGPAGCQPAAAARRHAEHRGRRAAPPEAMLANGARPPSAITVDKEFLGSRRPSARSCSPTCARTSRDLRRPREQRPPALLPPGLDWKPVGHTAVEAALIDQRKVAREEVCGVYQIPPPMLGILDRATFSNIEVQREMAYTDSLAPPLVLIEQALNAQLVRALLRETTSTSSTTSPASSAATASRRSRRCARRSAPRCSRPTRRARSTTGRAATTRAWTTSTSRPTISVGSAPSRTPPRPTPRPSAPDRPGDHAMADETSTPPTCRR